MKWCAHGRVPFLDLVSDTRRQRRNLRHPLHRWGDRGRRQVVSTILWVWSNGSIHLTRACSSLWRDLLSNQRLLSMRLQILSARTCQGIRRHANCDKWRQG